MPNVKNTISLDDFNLMFKNMNSLLDIHTPMYLDMRKLFENYHP